MTARLTRLPRFWQLIVLVLTLAGLPASPARADSPSEPFSTANSDWQGLSEFVALAQETWGREAVHVVAELDYAELSSRDSLIVFAPSEALDAESVTAFLAAGGRVAIIDDYGESPPLLERFGIRREAMTEQPRFSLRDNPQLAIAVPVLEALPGEATGQHPMTLGVERVVTNHPILLRHPQLTPVLEIPFSDGRAGILGVTGMVSGSGRLLVLSDPSIFINLMLRYPGNRTLAHGMLDYLRERAADESGSSRLWIAAGHFSQAGYYGGDLPLAERIREGFTALGRAARSVRDEGLPSFWSLILAGAIAVLILRSELRLNVSPPRHILPLFARARPLAAQNGVASRAEVLGAPQTSAVLSILEMDLALREAVELRLGVSSGLSRAELTEALFKRGMTQSESVSLVTLLEDMRAFGSTLSNRRPARPSRAELKRLHVTAMDLLSAIKRTERNL